MLDPHQLVLLSSTPMATRTTTISKSLDDWMEHHEQTIQQVQGEILHMREDLQDVFGQLNDLSFKFSMMMPECSNRGGKMALLLGVRIVENKMVFKGTVRCIWSHLELRYPGLKMVILKAGFLGFSNTFTFTVLQKNRGCKLFLCTLMGKPYLGINGGKRMHELSLGMFFWNHYRLDLGPQNWRIIKENFLS